MLQDSEISLDNGNEGEAVSHLPHNQALSLVRRFNKQSCSSLKPRHSIGEVVGPQTLQWELKSPRCTWRRMICMPS